MADLLERLELAFNNRATKKRILSLISESGFLQCSKARVTEVLVFVCNKAPAVRAFGVSSLLHADLSVFP